MNDEAQAAQSEPPPVDVQYFDEGSKSVRILRDDLSVEILQPEKPPDPVPDKPPAPVCADGLHLFSVAPADTDTCQCGKYFYIVAKQLAGLAP